jgi:hypothetical protein
MFLQVFLDSGAGWQAPSARLLASAETIMKSLARNTSAFVLVSARSRGVGLFVRRRQLLLSVGDQNQKIRTACNGNTAQSPELDKRYQ